MSNTINKALFAALPELESAKKNASNPHLKSKYANLSAVMAAVEPIRAHGLWYRQVQHPNDTGACVETIYIHEDGDELSAGKTFVRADKQTPQGFGSALTYARRYSLQGAFGLDAEDDDGHVASQSHKATPPATITADQAGVLTNELRDRKITEQDLLKVAKDNLGTDVSSIDKLPAYAFNDALSWVQSQKENN